MRRYTIAAIPFILLVSCAIQLACSGGGITQPPQTYDAAYAPRNFEWSVGNERIFLNWDPVPFAEGYRVYISTDGVKFKLHSGATIVPSTSVIIADVQNGKPYYLGVSAVGSSGKETEIAYPGGTPDAEPITPTSVAPDQYLGVPPAAPKNLQGYAADHLVHLDWEKNTEPDLKDYLVFYHHISATAFTQFPPVPATKNYYDHNDVVNGEEYFYKVQARDKEELTSPDSNIVHYIPMSAPPLAPSLVTAVYSFIDGGVILNWDKTTIESDVVRFRIIRYDITNGWEKFNPLLDTSIVTFDYPRTKDPYDPTGLGYIYIPPFTDRFAEHGHIYRYELAAIDKDGQIGLPTLPPDVTVPK